MNRTLQAGLRNWSFANRVGGMLVFGWLVLCLLSSPASAQRATVPLDGTWSIEESVDPDAAPTSFSHTAPVPGLAHSASPPFPKVDEYQTHEWAWTLSVRDHVLPPTILMDGLGRNLQPRNYFWYERTFRAPSRMQRARLIIEKAQFGTAVWLNGKQIGEHMGMWTAGHFDLTPVMDWEGENRLVVRIGAHPGAVPDWVPVGTDGEKEYWTPGIYDDVTLLLSNDPEIESVQVAPHIESSDILVQTEVVNHGPACSINLTQQVKTWKDGQLIGKAVEQRVSLEAGEHRFVKQTVPIPNATLWTPDNPFLYVVETSSGGDSAKSRFGMREFHFANGTAVLNGKPVEMRGASITLHRFFADPNSAQLPWNDEWVRKFLTEIPKRMHWNAFRICIGPPPQHWLDVADESGLLLQYEFPVWDDREPMRSKNWSKDEIMTEYKEFVRDNWNHASVVLWDASNETHWAFLGDNVIPAVRALDLSNRPWENGYNGPQGPNDPYELHPYKFLMSPTISGYRHSLFKMSDLDNGPPEKFEWPGHAVIINEYDWLWLHRDGRPTVLSKPVYDALIGPNAKADQRYFMNAYLLAGLTEHWRATRQFAAVMYLAYLDAEGPRIYTADNFQDVRTLQFQPYFEDYMSEAFKPLGVNVKFWEPNLHAGAKQSIIIVLTNDADKGLTGTLELTLRPVSGQADASGAHADTTIDVATGGQNTYDLKVNVPQQPGEYELKATAKCGESWCPVVSRRRVTVVP
jgi:beta-galactosidase